MHKAYRALPLCLIMLAGCAGQTGTELKSTFDTGVAAYDQGDYANAYRLWHSIDTVDLAAMRNEAMLLRQGEGVPKDPKRAEDLFATAAAAGLPTAQADLADMLLKGEAGPPNPKAALPLLEAAAAANHPVAQYELAQLYETGGEGLVPQNMDTARQLYTAAASHGMKEAQARLDQLPKPDSAIRLMQPAPKAPAAAQANSGDLRPGQP